MCTARWVLTSEYNVKSPPLTRYRIFPQKIPSIPFCSQSYSRQTLIWTISLFVSFTCFQISYKWIHATYTFLCLSFTQYIFEMHLCFSMYFISVCFIAEYYSIIWIYYLLFIIHLCGHLSCLQFVLLMNKAILNVSTQIFWWTCFYFERMGG